MPGLCTWQIFQIKYNLIKILRTVHVIFNQFCDILTDNEISEIISWTIGQLVI